MNMRSQNTHFMFTVSSNYKYVQTVTELNIKPAGTVMPGDEENEAIQGQNNHMSVLLRDSLSEDRVECFF